MDSHLLERRFACIGARLVTHPEAPAGRLGFSLDVRRDAGGEHFELQVDPASPLEPMVLDVDPELRHLLLMVRDEGGKHRFVCGHDERHWFVAAIPAASGVVDVRTALEALKPAAVRRSQQRTGVRNRDRVRRRTAAYVRQGEWFFVLMGDLRFAEHLLLRHEPLSRGNGSKPHIAEWAFRRGGETVYVCSRRPTGLRSAEYDRLLARRPDARTWGWRPMVRNPEVFVRGRIRHPDHKTIVLRGWHRVFMNTEHEAPAAENVVFLD